MCVCLGEGAGLEGHPGVLYSRTEMDRRLWASAPRALCSDLLSIPLTSRDAQSEAGSDTCSLTGCSTYSFVRVLSLQGSACPSSTELVLVKQWAGLSFLWDMIWLAVSRFLDPDGDTELEPYCEPGFLTIHSSIQVRVLVMMPWVPRKGSSGKKISHKGPREEREAHGQFHLS